MPTLRQLDAHFLKRVVREGHVYHQYEGVTLADADGMIFLCPLCFAANGGPGDFVAALPDRTEIPVPDLSGEWAI